MNNNLDDLSPEDREWVLEELQKDSQKYKDRHSQWKTAYYSAILTVCGIFVAVCSTRTPSGGMEDWGFGIVLILSVVTCILAVINIEAFAAVYNELAFTLQIQGDPDEAKERANRTGNNRKIRDTLIRRFFYANVILLAFSFFLPYLINIMFGCEPII